MDLPLPVLQPSGDAAGGVAACDAAREETAAEKGTLQGVVTVHPSATEPAHLTGRIQAGQRLPAVGQDATLQVGLQTAEGLAGEDVEAGPLSEVPPWDRAACAAPRSARSCRRGTCGRRESRSPG